jgi:hypothetical protein
MSAKEMTAQLAAFPDSLTPIAAAWDECHKIFLALSEAAASSLEANGYELHRGDDLTSLVDGWVAESCPLVFVTAIDVDASGNETYTEILPQHAFANVGGRR